MRPLLLAVLTLTACQPPHVILTVTDSGNRATNAVDLRFVRDGGRPSVVGIRGKTFPVTITLTSAKLSESLDVEARDGAGATLARGHVDVLFPDGRGRASVDLLAACERPDSRGDDCALSGSETPGVCVDGACVSSSCGDGLTDPTAG